MGLLIFFLVFLVCIGIASAMLFAGIGSIVDSFNEKPCVECAETIKKDARKCRHCGAAQPEAVKAVAAQSTETAAQPAAGSSATDTRRLNEKVARLKDRPDLVALQAALREKRERRENRVVILASTGIAVVTIISALGGSSLRTLGVHFTVAFGVAWIVFALLTAIQRRQINEEYRAGVESLPEPAAAMEWEAG